MTFTHESALSLLMERCPFEGSLYEMSALDVYEHGLHCVGVQEFGSLDEALDWWRNEYDRAMAAMAEVMVGRSPDNPAVAVLFKWAIPKPKAAQPAPAVAVHGSRDNPASWKHATRCSVEDLNRACEWYARQQGWR